MSNIFIEGGQHAFTYARLSSLPNTRRDATPWDSGYLLNPGDSFSITLTAQGVYDYYCTPHEVAGMVGRIVVGDPVAWPVQPFGDAISDVAWRVFPPVETIVREGAVRR